MPFTFEDRFDEPFQQGKTKGARLGPQIPAETLEALAPGARATALQFEVLLGTAPADLTRISDEIRSHPGLETLITRILALIMFSPTDSVGTVEEAAVVLGTDRLRVLVNIWLLIEEKRTANWPIARSGIDPRSAEANIMSTSPESTWTPEMLCLASLVHLSESYPAPPAPNSAPGPSLDSRWQRERFERLVELLNGSSAR
jgi:hypothetical protein